MLLRLACSSACDVSLTGLCKCVWVTSGSAHKLNMQNSLPVLSVILAQLANCAYVILMSFWPGPRRFGPSALMQMSFSCRSDVVPLGIKQFQYPK